MVSTWVDKVDRWWFGVAMHGELLVATAIGSSAEDAASSLERCIPRGLERQRAGEATSGMSQVLAMLGRLEAGSEEPPRFQLCPDCVPQPLASVLAVAARIPRGYVASYGAIAIAAGTEARVVGHVMATNPLYPIVACHRVVGSDRGLVGYSGRQTGAALRAKLERLRAEAHGFEEPRTLSGGLDITPVERVLEKAFKEGVETGAQLSLW